MDSFALPVAPIARVAHDAGLAGLVGGNLFGRLALHPSVTEISDPAERGKVVNAAWRRAGSINGLGLLAVVGGWVGLRTSSLDPARLDGTERALALAGDVLVGVTAVTGVATAIQGVRFSRKEPGGAVPLTDGAHAAPQATDSETAAKRRLDQLGRIGLLAELGLLGVSAVLTEQDSRRGALRRVVRR